MSASGSRADSALILVQLQDDDGETFDFEYDLMRADVERLAEPYIARSVSLCGKVLRESGLGPADIEKVPVNGNCRRRSAARSVLRLRRGH
jgi:molecular chaperone DnaK